MVMIVISVGKIKELEDTNTALKVKEEEYITKISSLENQIIELKKVINNRLSPK